MDNNSNQFYNGNNFDIQAREFTRNPGQVMAYAGIRFVKTHYIFTFTWLCGLLIAGFANGMHVDSHTERQFQEALYNADEIEQKQLNYAISNSNAAYNQYYASKGWFSCDSYCSQLYDRYLQSQEKLKAVQAIHREAISEARKVVGIWSEYGVSDTRRLFWSCWEWGKNFAKRISFYDAIFLAMDSRNESIGIYFARLVIRILVNFSIGFITALISFVWQLFWFVRTYGAGFSGFVFFVLGAVAAFSLIVTAIFAMYATVMGTALVVMNMSGNTLEGVGRGRRHQRLHYS